MVKLSDGPTLDEQGKRLSAGDPVAVVAAIDLSSHAVIITVHGAD